MGVAGTGIGKSLTFELLAGLPDSSHIFISPIRGLVSSPTDNIAGRGSSLFSLLQAKTNHNGYAPSRVLDLLSHSKTKPHRAKLELIVRGGSGYPNWQGYQELLSKWNVLIREYASRQRDGTLDNGSWLRLAGNPGTRHHWQTNIPSQGKGRNVTWSTTPGPSSQQHWIGTHPLPPHHGAFGVLDFSRTTQSQGYSYPPHLQSSRANSVHQAS